MSTLRVTYQADRFAIVNGPHHLDGLTLDEYLLYVDDYRDGRHTVRQAFQLAAERHASRQPGAVAA